ncbi:MAG: hypothetical protein GY937_22200 [bacterium]|nr:hypothetical protein [bacterium]
MSIRAMQWVLVLALTCLVAASGAAQVREDLLEGDPLGGQGKVTSPVPAQDPDAPQKRVPKPKRHDPRKGKVPEEVTTPGAVRPSPMRPGMGQLDPNQVDSRPKADIGIRIVEAVLPRVEVVVEVKNNGPTALARKAIVSVRVDAGDACDWPSGNPVVPVSGLRVGETRQVVVRTRNPRCSERYTRPREELSVHASVSPSMRRGEGYADPNPANDRVSARLVEVLRDDRQTPAARGERRVRVKLSNLVFWMRCGRGAGDVCEIEWIKTQLHNASETTHDHPNLGIMQSGRSGDRLAHSPSHLKVRDGDLVGVPHAATAEAYAYEGETIEFVMKARDMDCSRDRDCRRGNTGKRVHRFQVPHFWPGFPGNCDARQSVHEMRGWSSSGEVGGTPHPRIQPEGHEVYPAQICFEPVAEGRSGF